MSSDAKFEANRANAAKSTGPKTPEGKAAAKMNALKHGLTAKQVVLPIESEADFTAFRDDLVERLAPDDALEAALVERIVLLAWRLRRSAVAEKDMLQHGIIRELNDTALTTFFDSLLSEKRCKFEPTTGHGFRSLIRHQDQLTKLSRYETTLERGLFRAMHELERLQERRAGMYVPPPVTVDVNISGGFVSQNPPAGTELPDLEDLWDEPTSVTPQSTSSG